MVDKFVNAPDWKNVEEYTTKIMKIMLESGLTYIEKDNVLTLVQSIIAREFTMLGVMVFLKEIADKDDKADKEKLSSLYS